MPNAVDAKGAKKPSEGTRNGGDRWQAQAKKRRLAGFLANRKAVVLPLLILLKATEVGGRADARLKYSRQNGREAMTKQVRICLDKLRRSKPEKIAITKCSAKKKIKKSRNEQGEKIESLFIARRIAYIERKFLQKTPKIYPSRTFFFFFSNSRLQSL